MKVQSQINQINEKLPTAIVFNDLINRKGFNTIAYFDGFSFDAYRMLISILRKYFHVFSFHTCLIHLI